MYDKGKTEMKLNYALILVLSLAVPAIAGAKTDVSSECMADIQKNCIDLNDSDLTDQTKSYTNDNKDDDPGSIGENCSKVENMTGKLSSDMGTLYNKCLTNMNKAIPKMAKSSQKACKTRLKEELAALQEGGNQMAGASKQDGKCGQDVGKKKGGGGGGGGMPSPPGGDQGDQPQQAGTPVDCSTTPDGPSCGPVCNNSAYLAKNPDEAAKCTGANYKPPLATAQNLGGDGVPSSSGNYGSSSGSADSSSSKSQFGDTAKTDSPGFKTGGDAGLHGTGGANKPGLPPNDDVTTIDKNTLVGKQGGGAGAAAGVGAGKGSYDPVTGSWIPPKLKNDTVNTNLFRPALREVASGPRVIGPDGILESSANMFLIHDTVLQIKLMPPKK